MWFNCSIWLSCCLLLWWTTVWCACFPRSLTPVVDAIHKSHARSTICPVDLKSAMRVDLKVLLYRKPPQPLESAMMDFFLPHGGSRNKLQSHQTIARITLKVFTDSCLFAHQTAMVLHYHSGHLSPMSVSIHKQRLKLLIIQPEGSNPGPSHWRGIPHKSTVHCRVNLFGCTLAV